MISQPCLFRIDPGHLAQYTVKVPLMLCLTKADITSRSVRGHIDLGILPEDLHCMCT